MCSSAAQPGGKKWRVQRGTGQISGASCLVQVKEQELSDGFCSLAGSELSEG